MSDFKWETPGTLTTSNSTGLNSLVDNDGNLSGTIDNTSSLNDTMDLELVLGSLDLSAQDAPAVWVYLIPSADGTNFDDSDETTTEALKPPISQVCASMTVRPGSGSEAKRRTVLEIPIQPRKFKLLLVNRTGVTFASSGNTLKYSLYNSQIV